MKTYCFIDNDGKYHNKAKGIRGDSLTCEDYIKLMKGITIETATKNYSKIDWKVGDVEIALKENVKINFDSYTKRLKVYDSLGKWVDTKPLIIKSELKDYKPTGIVPPSVRKYSTLSRN